MVVRNVKYNSFGDNWEAYSQAAEAEQSYHARLHCGSDGELIVRLEDLLFKFRNLNVGCVGIGKSFLFKMCSGTNGTDGRAW